MDIETGAVFFEHDATIICHFKIPPKVAWFAAGEGWFADANR